MRLGPRIERIGEMKAGLWGVSAVSIESWWNRYGAAAGVCAVSAASEMRIAAMMTIAHTTVALALPNKRGMHPSSYEFRRQNRFRLLARGTVRNPSLVETLPALYPPHGSAYHRR
jgi:hypothetical protein